MKSITFGMTFSLLVMLALIFDVQPIGASGTIYIRGDGSVDPSTAPIQRDGDIYTFTDNIYDNIVVERSNITVDGNGYTLQGSGGGYGFHLYGIKNVTIQNTNIKHWWYGVRLESSSNNNTITGNNITNNSAYGVYLFSSSFNNVSRNNITNNYFAGAWLYSSSSNTVSGNNITNNRFGVELHSSFNTISGNNITNNYWGVWLAGSYNIFSGNIITKNSLGVSLVWSSNNTVSGNVMNENESNFGVEGVEPSHFVHLIDVSNLINGKPVYYLVNQKDLLITPATHPQVGYLALINCVNITAEGLTLTNNGEGLLLAYTNNSRITGNNITNNDWGVELYSSSSNTVSGNTITNSYFAGVWLDSSSNNNTVSGNTITNSYYIGVTLAHSSNNNTISGNNITDCWDGVAVAKSSFNNVSGNTITNSDAYGVGLIQSSLNNISGNAITNNDRGVLLYSSSNNTVSGNKIANNNYGAWLNLSSNNNFHHNNFIENTQHAYINMSSHANLWDDGYPSGGNYWSDYNGTDSYSGSYQNETGSDGIGDIPYVIDENNTDMYPLMKPHPWAPHDLAITNVVTSKTVVGQGFNLSINVTIFNYGNTPENFNITAYTDQNIAIIGDEITIGTKNITLTRENSTTVSFTWNTTGVAQGNYTITVYVHPVPGETDTSDNMFMDGKVTVVHPGDLNNDGVVDIADVVMVTAVYRSKCGDPDYKSNSDIIEDGVIDIADVVAVINHYRETGS